MTPLVSCVIGTYNYAEFLPRAIESVLAQDYPAEALEIIVVDDGSTDDTPAVIAPYLDRVRYVRKQNAGHLSTFDRGLREATGDYVALLDADDEWLPGKTRAQVELLEADPSLGLAHGDLVVVDPDGDVLAPSFFAQHGMPAVEGDLLGMLLQRNVVTTSALMVRRSVALAAVPIPDWARAQDWWLAIKAAETGRIGCTPWPVTRYRRHGSNMNAGQADARRVRLLKREIPLRRRMLHSGETASVPADALVSALTAFHDTVATVVVELKRPAREILKVSAEQRRRAQLLRGQAAASLSGGDADGAARRLVAAAALDPLDERAYDQAVELGRELGWSRTAGIPAPARRDEDVEGARAFAVLADASELIADPSLLRGYAAEFGSGDDATLVIRVDGEEALEPLSLAVADAGLADDDAADLLAVPSVQLDDRSAALRVDAVLTGRLPDGRLGALPAAAADGVGALRAYSSRIAGEDAPLSFCITFCAPSWAVAPSWGDLHFGRALQQELHRRGHPCAIEPIEGWPAARRERFDVVLHLRGLQARAAGPGQLGVLWSISHPDLLGTAECDLADLVLVASEPFAASLAERTSTRVEVLEQATDPGVFHPDPDPRAAHELVFVGNSRRVRRPIIDDLLPTSRDLAIWGADWEPLIGAEHVRGHYLPNDQVRRVYSSAGVVLNDHWEDMRRHGFASNRLYDAVACGAVVVTDHVDGVAERFGGAVLTYSTRDELGALVEHLLANPGERAERGAAGREIVVGAHTFAHRVERLLELAHEATGRLALVS